MQDYAFDPALKGNKDIAKQRAAQDPELIRAFVKDNRLNNQLFGPIYEAGAVLREEEVDYAEIQEEE